jgi:hypothetical protein
MAEVLEAPSKRLKTVERTERRRRRRRRVLRRRFALVAVLLFLPVLYSYVSTMAKPSSLPLGVRSVEWVRANHGAWAVDTVERWWYTWHAPKPGGPALTTLPEVGRPVRTIAVTARRYTPAVVVPLVRPRLPGEGAWSSVGPRVGGVAPVLVTTFRPDPVYPRIVAYAAWIDHTRTALGLYPGRYEPPGASPRGPMQVPVGARWGLLATFNSGFTYRDGHGGFAVDGATVTSLRDGLGTLAAYRNGRVDVFTWHGGPVAPRRVVLARQNLPLIVDRGRLNPLLSEGSLWGATLGNAVRVWRSAVGVDRHGNLVYVAANDQTAQSIGKILIHLGVVRGIELDINAEWPSFITYGSHGGLDPLKLVPNGMQSVTRYLVPDDRDFFAVYAHARGQSFSVPF